MRTQFIDESGIIIVDGDLELQIYMAGDRIGPYTILSTHWDADTNDQEFLKVHLMHEAYLMS